MNFILIKKAGLFYLLIAYMNKKYYQKLFLIGFATILCTSCSYIKHYQQQAKYSVIKNNISLSTLNKVSEFTSRTPFNKTYELDLGLLETNRMH